MMRTLATARAALAAAGLTLAGLAGCAASVPRGATIAPADFSLDALVLVPEGSEPSPSTPRARRPARYQLEPDGSLRAALGVGVGPDTIPALARRLTPSERDGLWRLARDAGLLGQDVPGRISWGGTWDPPPIGASAILSVTHDGHRVHVGAPLAFGGGSPEVEALLDRLAALAWEPDVSWASAPAGD